MATATWREAGPEDVRRIQWQRPRQPRPEEISYEGKRLLTVRKAAETVGLAMPTIYRWIGSGTLPHYRSGNWIRVDLEDLRAAAPGVIPEILS